MVVRTSSNDSDCSASCYYDGNDGDSGINDGFVMLLIVLMLIVVVMLW